MSDPILRAPALSAQAKRPAARPALRHEARPAAARPAVAEAPAAPSAAAAQPGPRLEQDFAALREAARRQGHDEGLARGLAEGRAAAKEEAHGDAQIAGLEGVLLQSVMAACRRLLGPAVDDGRAVQSAVRAALAAARQEEVLALRLHPDDLPAARAALASGPHAALQLQPDADLPRGGCVLAFTGGSLDARLDTQMRRLGAALAGELAEPPGTGPAP
jgi:flagellar assembly protein FliH